MHFEADLDVVVDGTSAHVRGDGAALVIESADPGALVSALRRAAGAPTRPQLTLVANGLARRGASIHVEGPRGRFVTVGADADSYALGLLTGTRHLAPGWSAVLFSLVAVLKRRRALVLVGAGVAIASTIVARRTTSGR